MSSPEHDPKRAASEVGGAPVGTEQSDPEVIDVRRGMFGVHGSGDTSGYGRLVRQITLDDGSPRPYGGYFDEVVDLDKVMRDPVHLERLLPEYDSGDHLHPSPRGYNAMGSAIPLSLFVH